jgi:hypothetical protein
MTSVPIKMLGMHMRAKGCVQVSALSANLNDLSVLVHDERVMAHSKLFETNTESMKALVHFLKMYSKSLTKDAPLKAQRHKLEFIVPCVPKFPPHAPKMLPASCLASNAPPLVLKCPMHKRCLQRPWRCDV